MSDDFETSRGSASRRLMRPCHRRAALTGRTIQVKYPDDTAAGFTLALNIIVAAPSETQTAGQPNDLTDPLPGARNNLHR